jgi:hypothetical protein
VRRENGDEGKGEIRTRRRCRERGSNREMEKRVLSLSWGGGYAGSAKEKEARYEQGWRGSGERRIETVKREEQAE